MSSLYQVLEIEPSASDKEIRSAYRRRALVCHPDKARDKTEEAEFRRQFDEVAFAYGVLCDRERRARYDATGDTDPALVHDLDGLRSMYGSGLAAEAIVEDKRVYQHSDEEKEHVLFYYKQSHGDMDAVFENVLHSSPLDDEDRFCKIIDEAIASRQVPKYPQYSRNRRKGALRRAGRARAEAAEAESMAKQLGVNAIACGDEAGLAALIQRRRAKSSAVFLDNLEKKYVQSAKVKKPSSSKSRK